MLKAHFLHIKLTLYIYTYALCMCACAREVCSYMFVDVRAYFCHVLKSHSLRANAHHVYLHLCLLCACAFVHFLWILLCACILFRHAMDHVLKALLAHANSYPVCLHLMHLVMCVCKCTYACACARACALYERLRILFCHAMDHVLNAHFLHAPTHSQYVYTLCTW